MIEGPPYVLTLKTPHWEWVIDEEGSYPSLVPEIEEWAMENLQRAWTVHLGRRKPTEDEMKKLSSEFHNLTIRHVWIEFLEYNDWLLFKLRWRG